MPATARRFEIRLPDDLAAAVDAWRKAQPDIPDRAEAARRLMRAGLSAHQAVMAAKPADVSPITQETAVIRPQVAESRIVAPLFKAKAPTPKPIKTGGKLPIPPRR